MSPQANHGPFQIAASPLSPNIIASSSGDKFLVRIKLPGGNTSMLQVHGNEIIQSIFERICSLKEFDPEDCYLKARWKQTVDESETNQPVNEGKLEKISNLSPAFSEISHKIQDLVLHCKSSAFVRSIRSQKSLRKRKKGGSRKSIKGIMKRLDIPITLDINALDGSSGKNDPAAKMSGLASFLNRVTIDDSVLYDDESDDDEVKEDSSSSKEDFGSKIIINSPESSEHIYNDEKTSIESENDTLESNDQSPEQADSAIKVSDEGQSDIEQNQAQKDIEKIVDKPSDGNIKTPIESENDTLESSDQSPEQSDSATKVSDEGQSDIEQNQAQKDIEKIVDKPSDGNIKTESKETDERFASDEASIVPETPSRRKRAFRPRRNTQTIEDSTVPDESRATSPTSMQASSDQKPRLIRGRSLSIKKTNRLSLDEYQLSGVPASPTEKSTKRTSVSSSKSTSESINSVLMRISIMSFSDPMTLKIHPSALMEDILKDICELRQLDFEECRIEFPDGMVAELDRQWNYYKDLGRVADIKISRGPKAFSTIVIMEDGKQVAVLKNILGKFTIIAATPDQLLEHCIHPDNHNIQFLDVFLMTFRRYIRPEKVFDYLIWQFNVGSLVVEEKLIIDAANDSIEKPPTTLSHHRVQLKVLSVLKWWVKHHWYDFRLNSDLKHDLYEFVDFLSDYAPEMDIDAHCVDEYKDHTQWLKTAFDENQKYDEKIDILGPNVAAPISRMNLAGGSFNALNDSSVNVSNKSISDVKGTLTRYSKVLDKISAQDLAEQLTLKTFSLFKRIHAIEYLNAVWKHTTSTSVSKWRTPLLDRFTARFDTECQWISDELTCRPKIKSQTNLLKKFIHTAIICKDIGNFSLMFSIYAGLNSTPVSRLEKAWSRIGQKTRKEYADLEQACSPSKNMKKMRELMRAHQPPMIPFLPVVLKDLTFMEDGNETEILDGMINFEKLTMMANRVREITNLRGYKYSFVRKNLKLI